ncbi:MAG: lactate permease LctP family transporter [Bryobacteraceae bacterium]|nr:lactate permease LctP family transporter [Bryobacteraceae bacterium]
MWNHDYTPIGGSLALSTIVAALPIFVLLLLLGVIRKPAWIAALSGLGAAAVVAVGAYGMPASTMIGAATYGAAFGLFPIGWIVFWAIYLYRLTLETGKFEVIKDSIGSLTDDRRLQALLIAFAFGAFIEGAAGFGTPVAVAAAMMAGLGFSPFYAAAICLLANTAPVAFGSIGIPVVTLSAITGLDLYALSGDVGKICAPVSLFIPAYLVVVMGGWKGLRGVFPAAAACGISFASVQFLVSNYLGPYLTDILSSLAAIGALVVLFRVWQPKDGFTMEGNASEHVAPKRHPIRQVIHAWSPYYLLVIMVLLWGLEPVKAVLNAVNVAWEWPVLHNLVQRMEPLVPQPSPYPAVYTLSWLSASGTACLIASLLSVAVLRMSAAQAIKVFVATCKQLFLPLVTIASVLGLAFLMNYSGATVTLGLAFAATGALFPFFSAMLGWLGVFLTGSDTSSNALFGNLQVVTANRLGFDAVLMAAANSSGGVMGKMISLQSIAVAAAATAMASKQESNLFRFTLRHSILLASVIGVITAIYAYAGR